MNIENISKYIAAIPTLILSVLMTSLTAFFFILIILKTLDNPLSIFSIALMCAGIIITFTILLFLLETFEEIFINTFFYGYAFLIALCFVLVILENPFSMLNTALMCVGLISTFTIMLLSLDVFQRLFYALIFFFLALLIQSASLIKTTTKRIKNCKKTKGAA